ncbi:MAG TPA: hypothetical protein VFE24_16850 [Pirellulales bacterium]|nr:hypothetical protein [Pirellulales bacterium]
MYKSLILTVLCVSTWAASGRADDLFARPATETPFSGAKGAGGEPSSKPTKILNGDHLGEMLRDAQLEPKVEADDFVTLSFHQGHFDFPVAMNLTDHNSRLWVVFLVAKLDATHRLNAEQLTGILTANRDLRPAAFAIGDGGKRLELYLALPNEQISPKVLRDNLQTLAGVAESTAPLWETSAAAANAVASRNPAGQPPRESGQPTGAPPANQTVAAPTNPPAPVQNPTRTSTPETNPAPAPNPRTNIPANTNANYPELAGIWSTSFGDKDGLALSMRSDGQFTIVHVKDGKQTKSSGKFSYDNGTLSLVGADAFKLAGRITNLGDKSFEFTPQGAAATAKWTLKRAK